MKTCYFKMAGGLLSALFCGVNAWSAPFQRADVPADAAWVVHVDCDAIRPTAVGQYILGEMAKPENKAKISVLESLVGMDIATQLHGLTLYNSDTMPEDGVLIVYADFNADKLNNLALASKDPESTTHNGTTIRSWIDEKRKPDENRRVYGAVKGNRVILGQQQATVAAALDVIDGGASLAGSQNFPQMGGAGEQKCIQAAAHRLDLPGNNPRAALFKLAQGMRLDAGESDGQVKATLALQAKDDEVANQMYSVAQGLLALMKLENKPATAKLANAISVKQDNAWVVATLSIPADDMVQALKAQEARRARRQAENQ